MKKLMLLLASLLINLYSFAAINQKVMTEIPENQVQGVIDAQKSQGYIPIYIDAFQHSTQVATNPGTKLTYFNFVFEKVNNPNDYQISIASPFIVNVAGHAIKFLESYINSQGQLRFALVTKSGNNPPFQAKHVKSSDFQATFNALKNQGYHLKTRSVVKVGAVNYTSALFVKSNVGSWVSKSNLTLAQATAEMQANKTAGRTLVHMDIPYGIPTKYNLVFHQLPANNGWYAQNGLTKQQLAVAVSNAKNQGYRTTIVSGYDQPALINGNEVKVIRYAATFVKPKSGVGGLVSFP
jgi:hypothetical protein